MSHFVTLVLVPKDSLDVQGTVSMLLASYDEEITVAPYATDCWCIGNTARHAGIEAANREAGNLDDLRTRYWNLDDVNRPTWDAWVADWQAVAGLSEGRPGLRRVRRLRPAPDHLQSEQPLGRMAELTQPGEGEGSGHEGEGVGANANCHHCDSQACHRICRVLSVQRGPGNVEESAQWAGIRVWLTAEATAYAQRECYGVDAWVRQSSPESQHRDWSQRNPNDNRMSQTRDKIS